MKTIIKVDYMKTNEEMQANENAAAGLKTNTRRVNTWKGMLQK